MTTSITNRRPSADVAHVSRAADMAQLVAVLRLPDVSGTEDVTAIEPENLVTLAAFLEQKIVDANAAFASALGPVYDALERARAGVKAAIIKNGGKALPHDTFDVRLEQPTRAQKRIDVLRRLEGVLPDDQYAEAVYVESVDVRHADRKAVQDLIDAGAEPTWNANLVKLHKFARDYGGEVAAIVAEGTPRVAVGVERLVIEPRKSALRSVGL